MRDYVSRISHTHALLFPMKHFQFVPLTNKIHTFLFSYEDKSIFCHSVSRFTRVSLRNLTGWCQAIFSVQLFILVYVEGAFNS